MKWESGSAQGAVKLLLVLALLAAAASLVSCGAAPTSTAITCTTTTSTSSTTTSTSTCTDPVTSISVTISPATVSVNVVTTEQFVDSIQGGTNSVTIWQVNGIVGGNDTIGRIDSNGLYHAPTTVPSPSTVSVTAVSFEDQKVSATSTVTITPAPTVTITSPTAPITVSAGAANTVTFTATETGGSTNIIQWFVAPVGGLGVLGGNATLGTISAAGVYSPPATPPIGQTVNVIAGAQDSPNVTASLAVTISGYATSSLQGNFAFSIAGTNAAGRFFRAGSFTADGLGTLSGVLEDTDASSGASSTPISTTGAYTLGADGRGTLQLNDGLSPASFRFVMVNNSQLQIIGFDAGGTAAGQANAQDATTFSGAPLLALSGTYVFDFSGVHGVNGLSEAGEFSADGSGNITQGLIDINDGGTASPLQIAGSRTVCTPAPPALSTYTIAANGRGTLTLQTLNTACAAGPVLTFNFYVVSRGAAKFVSSDTTLEASGYSTQQAPNASFSASTLNGSFAFLLAGSSAGGPLATAGSFVADGSGHISSGVLDENRNGTPAANVAFNAGGTYTLASNGRGTLTFATASRTYTSVFYVGTVGIGATAVFQETDSGITSDGTFVAQQSGPFTLASIQGNYAIATSGTTGGSARVVSGQIGTDGAGNVEATPAAAVDINTAGVLLPGVAATGTYTAPAANGRATIALNPLSTGYAVYVVSSTEDFLLDLQSGQLAAGALLRQF